MEQKINGICFAPFRSFIAWILVVGLGCSGFYSFGDCPTPVKPIHQGEVVDCDGFRFSPDAEQQAEQARDDASYYQKYAYQLKEKAALEQDENDVLQKRLNLYIQESSQLAKEKASKDTTEDIIRIGYFSLGVIVTALIARNVQR
jgi:hypothetical protein